MEIRRLTDQRVPLLLGLCGVVAAVAGAILLVPTLLGRILVGIGMVLVVVVGSELDRRKRLEGLLEFSPRPKRRLKPHELGAKASVIARERFPDPDLPPPYIRRERYDLPLESALRSRKRFAVVKGVTNSGKTRAVFEAIGRVTPDYKVVLPNDPTEGGDALSEVLQTKWLLRRWGRYVLVINDLENRLSALQGHAVRKWLKSHPRSLIVATMSAEHWAHLLAEEQTSQARAATKLLDLAETVPFAPEFNGKPLIEARDLYGLPEGQTRLGVYLASAERAVARFEATEGSQRGAARALAFSGINCARAELFRSVSLSQLVEMAKRVALFENRRFSEAEWEEAIRYCTDGEDGVGAILEVDPSREDQEERRVVANPALVELVDRGPRRDETNKELPDMVWRAIVDLIAEGSFDLLRIAHAAHWRGRPDLARQLFEQLASVDDEPGQVARERLREPGRTNEPSYVTDLLERSTGGPLPRHAAARRRKLKQTQVHSTIFDSKNYRAERWKGFYRHQVLRDCARFVLLLVFDVIAVCAGILIAKRLGAVAFASPAKGFSSLTVVLIASMLVLIFFLLFGLYRADRERARLAEILKSISLAAVALSLWVIGKGFALINLPIAGMAAAVAIGLAYLFRSAYDHISRRWVRKRGLQSRVLLLASERPTATAHLLASGCRRPMQMVGYLSSEKLQEPGMLGGLDSMQRIALEYEIDRVIVAEPKMSPQERLPIIYQCHALDLVTEIVPNSAELFQGASDALDEMIVPLVQVYPLYLNYVGKVAKRAMDVFLAMLLMPLLLLAMLFIGLPMKLHRPRERVVNWDYRPGLGAVTFPMRRFRTDYEGVTTRVGRWLKRTRFDELPQLLNVLDGSMSMVGPRPLTPEQFDALDEFQRARNTVLPGVTGLWQVARRKETSLEDMSSLDIVYCRKWTPLLDLTILLLTLPAVLTAPALSLEDEPPLPRVGEVADVTG
jgi:lipopolysaccharide/colanic/teichoic acid biosynthesis glycosyltransferase